MEAELTGLDGEWLQANRYELVSRLADDLAHEIKNPLNAIVINLEVLRVRAGRGDTAGTLDRAAVIEHETRRLHQLIERLLLLLRPERDEGERGDSLALDRVLDELLPLIEAQVRLARNEFACSGETAHVMAADRTALKFALLNALLAVHDGLGQGGGTLTLNCAADRDRVRLTVVAEPPAQAGAFERPVAAAAALLAPRGGGAVEVRGGIELAVIRVGA